MGSMSKHFNLKRITLTSKKNWWMGENISSIGQR